MPPADFDVLVRRVLVSAPMLVAPGCDRTPPATVAPEDAAASSDEPTAPRDRAPPTGNGERPRVVSARFIDASHVELTFSEAVAPTHDVNPRQFRISHGYETIEGPTYAYATYADPGYMNGEDDPPIVVTRLEHGTEEHRLGLKLSRDVPTEVCEDIMAAKRDMEELETERLADPDASEDEESVETRTGLYLHYTQRGSHGVQDRDGEKLEDIGAGWALNYGSRYRETQGTPPVARFDLLVEVECFDVPDPYEMQEGEDGYDSGGYGYGYGYGSIGDAPVPVPQGKVKAGKAPEGVPGGVPGGVVGGTGRVPGGVATKATRPRAAAGKKPATKRPPKPERTKPD